MSNTNDYAKALGVLEGAVKAALVDLDHNFYVDAKRRLRGALVRVEEILSKDVPSHHLPDGPVSNELVPVSERCEGRTVLDYDPQLHPTDEELQAEMDGEPGLDQPDTTEEKRGER